MANLNNSSELNERAILQRLKDLLREPVRNGEALRAFTSPRPELATGWSYYQTSARAIYSL